MLKCHTKIIAELMQMKNFFIYLIFIAFLKICNICDEEQLLNLIGLKMHTFDIVCTNASNPVFHLFSEGRNQYRQFSLC